MATKKSSLLRPRNVFVGFILLNVAVALLYVFDIYRPWGLYESDYYFPYLALSWPVAWIIAIKCADYTIYLGKGIFHLKLSWETEILVIPGIFNSLIGGAQWSLLAWYVGRGRDAAGQNERGRSRGTTTGRDPNT